MNCALLTDACKLIITEVDKPQLRPTEVLIEVELAAICGSDASLYYGKCNVPFPVIPGHEAVGTIAGVGEEVSVFSEGMRVLFMPNYGCGVCPVCKQGLPNICPQKIRIGLDSNGVFADYVAVPAHVVVPVPDGLPNRIAIFTEPTAVALHALKKARPAKGQKALIFGAGVMGLLMTQLVVNEGAEAYTTDLVQGRLDLSKKLGARDGFVSSETLIENGPYDIIYETSGAPMGLANAMEVAAPGGTIVVLGLAGQPHPVLSSTIVRKELTILGSMIYTDEFPEVLELLASGVIQTEPLITSVLSIEELPESLESFSAPDRVKTLVQIKK